MSKLHFCSEEDRLLVERTLEAVDRGLGEKVRAVMLVGAAVPVARYEGARPRELLVVVSDLPVPALCNLARQAQPSLAAGLQLRLLTQGEILRSADVFTLELCEVQARHLLLAGEDPFGDLYFTGGELRRSLEHALRTLARELRQAILSRAAAAAGGAEDGRLLRDVVDRVAVIAANAARLVGADAATTEVELIEGLAALAELEARAALAAVRSLRAGETPADSLSLLATLLELCDGAARTVDRLGAGERA